MSTFAIHSHVACTSFAESGSRFAAKSAHPISTKRTRRTKVRRHKNRIPSGSATTLTYDLNGNMTSDGTNSYAWVCENRLIKVTYPGTGNYSTFAYDGFSRNVQILEYASSSLTSTKDFVWDGDQRCEARNSPGAVTAQYSGRGETMSGTKYYFALDLLGSTRELLSAQGAVAAELGYDPFGRVAVVQGSTMPDLQFAGYYSHQSSGLNLTRTRAYASALGRWITRDPSGEDEGTNLFDYVDNEPVLFSDPYGLFGAHPPPLPRPPRPPKNPQKGCPYKWYNDCTDCCNDNFRRQVEYFTGRGYTLDEAFTFWRQVLQDCLYNCHQGTQCRPWQEPKPSPPIPSAGGGPTGAPPPPPPPQNNPPPKNTTPTVPAPSDQSRGGGGGSW